MKYSTWLKRGARGLVDTATPEPPVLSSHGQPHHVLRHRCQQRALGPCLFQAVCRPSSKDSTVVTSHAIMVLVVSLAMARNVMMRILSWHIQVLESCPWQMLAPTQMVPSFSSALPRLTGWMASMWSLARWKKAWVLWKPWSSLGPGMARPARRSPLVTVDKSNKFDLPFTWKQTNLWAQKPESTAYLRTEPLGTELRILRALLGPIFPKQNILNFPFQHPWETRMVEVQWPKVPESWVF